MNVDEAIRIGHKIVGLLDLVPTKETSGLPMKDWHYNTLYGVRSVEGIGRAVSSIVTGANYV